MSDTTEESLTTVKEYVDAFKEGAEMKYDEASGTVLVNTESFGWIPTMTSSSEPTITGDLRVSYTPAVLTQGGGSGYGYAATEPGPGYLQAMSTLNRLVTAVEAGTCCRCAPTEVCPECHDLNQALDSAKKTLNEFSRPISKTGESRWHTVSTGTTFIPGNTLSVATSGSSAGLTFKAGT